MEILLFENNSITLKRINKGKNRCNLLLLAKNLRGGEMAVDEVAVNATWRGFFMGTHPDLRRNRHLYGLIPSSPRCKWCNTPFKGPGGAAFRLVGRRPSPLNPRYCNICDFFASQHLGGAEVEVSMLFADVRGSTPLAEQIGNLAFSRLISRFYAEATRVLVQADALIDKIVGDQVTGFFVTGFCGPDHPRVAVETAQKLLRALGYDHDQDGWIPIGAGVHTGVAFMGAVGAVDGVVDVTALGDAVNIAARLSSSSASGEILVSDEAYEAAHLNGNEERRALQLKGKSQPVGVRVLRV
jgi:adenylate cyclase